MSDAQQPQRESSTVEQPTMSRRTLMRRAGAGTLAAGAIAGGASQAPPSLNPVQEADAWVPLVAAGGIGIAVGLAAGIGIKTAWGGSDSSVEKTANTTSYVHAVGSAIANNRSGPNGVRTGLKADYVDAPEGQSAFARSATDAIFNAAAYAVLEGDSASAQSRAVDALDKQFTRSMVNMIEMFNEAVLYALEESAIQEDFEEGTGVWKVETSDGNNYGLKPVATFPDVSAISMVPGSDVANADNPMAAYATFPDDAFPAKPTELEGRTEPAKIVGLNWDSNPGGELNFIKMGSNPNFIRKHLREEYAPVGGDQSGSISSVGSSQVDYSIYVSDDKLGKKKVFDGGIWRQTINQIQAEYQSIQSELSTVVDEVVNGLEQGAIPIESIIDTQDLVGDFNAQNRRSALHRQALAVGMEFPGDISQQVKISHPQLEADSLWGDLMIRSSDGSQIKITGAETIPASDYEFAILGYTNQVTGEYQSAELSGASGNDLEILEIAGDMDTETNINKTTENDGDTPLAEEGSDKLPEAITDPDPKYDDYPIAVNLADGTTEYVTVGELFKENGTWKAPTSFGSGKTVESFRVTRPANYQPTEVVRTPVATTTYDASRAETVTKRRREINDAIDEQFGGGGSPAGGLFGDGGLPSFPGLSPIASFGVVLLGLFGLGQLSN